MNLPERALQRLINEELKQTQREDKIVKSSLACQQTTTSRAENVSEFTANTQPRG